MTEQERNKQIVRDYFEQCWSKDNLEFGRTMIGDDYDFHMPLPPGTPRGFEQWKKGVGRYHAAFTDTHWEIRQILAEGDLVAVRTVWTGTHSGETMGVPATGRRVIAANSDFYRLRDGMFIEHWDVPDFLSVLRQIGGSIENVPKMYAASLEK